MSLILPASGEIAVQRGREASAKLRDLVIEYQARGDQVLEVRVSDHVASHMRAYFASAFLGFDNVLPKTVCGVPFAEGGTGGRDYVIHTRKRGRIEH